MGEIKKRDSIKDIRQEFEEFKKTINSDFQNLKNNFEEVDENINEKSADFNESKNNLNSFLESKKEEFVKIQEKIDNFNRYYNKLFTTNNGTRATKEEIENFKEEIENFKNYLMQDTKENISLKKQIENIYNDLDQKRRAVFGIKDKDGNIIENGIYQEIKNIEEDIEKIKKEKEKEMDNLLNEMEISRNAISQESLSKFIKERADEKHKHSNNILKIIFFTNVVILIIVFTSFKFLPDFYDNIYINFIIKLSITFPFIYYMINLSLKYKRDVSLEDQYVYKANIMATYRSIVSLIETKKDFLDIDQKKQYDLLERTYEKILENEADKVDKKDKGIIYCFEKIVNNISKVLNITKEQSFDIIDCVVDNIKTIRNKKSEKDKKENEEIQDNEDINNE